MGPVLTGSKINLTGVALAAGTARLRWTANWDRDNKDLTYTLIRNSDALHPVYREPAAAVHVLAAP